MSNKLTTKFASSAAAVIMALVFNNSKGAFAADDCKQGYDTNEIAEILLKTAHGSWNSKFIGGMAPNARKEVIENLLSKVSNEADRVKIEVRGIFRRLGSSKNPGDSTEQRAMKMVGKLGEKYPHYAHVFEGIKSGKITGVSAANVEIDTTSVEHRSSIQGFFASVPEGEIICIESKETSAPPASSVNNNQLSL